MAAMAANANFDRQFEWTAPVACCRRKKSLYRAYLTKVWRSRVARYLTGGQVCSNRTSCTPIYAALRLPMALRYLAHIYVHAQIPHFSTNLSNIDLHRGAPHHVNITKNAILCQYRSLTPKYMQTLTGVREINRRTSCALLFS